MASPTGTPLTGASNAGVEAWKAQIEIVGDSWLGYRSMTRLTCEQQLPQSAVHLRRRISKCIFIAVCSMRDYDEDSTEQCTQC